MLSEKFQDQNNSIFNKWNQHQVQGRTFSALNNAEKARKTPHWDVFEQREISKEYTQVKTTCEAVNTQGEQYQQCRFKILHKDCQAVDSKRIEPETYEEFEEGLRTSREEEGLQYY